MKKQSAFEKANAKAATARSVFKAYNYLVGCKDRKKIGKKMSAFFIAVADEFVTISKMSTSTLKEKKIAKDSARIYRKLGENISQFVSED